MLNFRKVAERIAEQHEFDLENDCDENVLFENRIKARRTRRRSMFAMSAFRLNQLGLEDNEHVNASSAVEISQASNNNPGKLGGISAIDESNWQGDASERSRRIAEWWRSLMMASNGEWLPYFERMRAAMSLLRQPSSAIIERVFSQVNRMRSLRGDKLKEGNFEIRALLQCNRNCDAHDR